MESRCLLCLRPFAASCLLAKELMVRHPTVATLDIQIEFLGFLAHFLAKLYQELRKASTMAQASDIQTAGCRVPGS